MKKYTLIMICVLSVKATFSQTNTFPSTGNAGIGITNPQASLDIYKAYDATNTKALKMFYYGSWAYGLYANNFRFIDIESTENGKILQLNGYGMGIGFDPPSYNTPSDKLYVNGNVGIGTNSPSYKLDVNGTGNFTGKSWFSYGNINMSGYSWTDAALTTNSIEIVNNNAPAGNLAPTLVFHSYGTGGPQFRLATDGSNVLYLESAGANSSRKPIPYGGGPNSYFSRFHIDGGLTTIGNVGIGTTTPTEKLSVKGKIRAQEIKVENGNWPDYVFAKDYQLPSLREMAKHIKEKGHLPGIPSAVEVKTNGIDLGEMNAKLLQKIEELTLYLIEQNKRLDTQQQEINNLKQNKK